MDEFSIIEKYFSPLAKGCQEALGLKDDAAVFNGRKGYEFVITKDAIIESVHFLENTSPELISSKLIRVNLSDMAAMGAIPRFYLLAVMLNDSVDSKWFRKFSSALKKEQDNFGIKLIGGDTTKGNGPLSFSVTMIGEVKTGKALLRSGAKAGDLIYVSGTIGDAALGLECLRKEIPGLNQKDTSYLIKRYNVPQPRVELGKKLIGIASSAIDISDGLISDLGHICECSGVSAIIEAQNIPFSPAVSEVIKVDSKYFEMAVTGGDDYELLFTIPPGNEKKLAYIAGELNCRISKIGKIIKGDIKNDSYLIDNKGNNIKISKRGYSHF